MTESKEVPIPASWPQQKAIWSICRRTCKGTADSYQGCNFETVKTATDVGNLTRKRASDIIASFYDKKPGTFEALVNQHVDSAFRVDETKFLAAERRTKKHKTERYTRPEEERKKEEEDDAPTARPTGGTPQPRRQPNGDKYKVGDHVDYIGTSTPKLKGNDGIVVMVSGSLLKVHWKKPFESGHNCGGLCPSGEGWNVVEDEVRHHEEASTTTDTPTAAPFGSEEVETDEEFAKKMKRMAEEREAKIRERAEKAAREEAEREAAEKESKEKAAREAEEARKKAEEEEAKRKEEEAKRFSTKTPGYVKPDIFDDVCLMVQNGVQVCLVGPSGCGKSMLFTEIAKVLGREMYTESFAGGKRYAQVFGGTHLHSGESTWIAAAFLKAVQKPGIVFMDEVMSGDADVLIGCNSILDIKTRRFYTPDGPVEVHPECTIVGASNVTGREYNPNYKGTQQQDASVLNRFVQVPMTYDPLVEELICKNSKLTKAVWSKIIGWMTALRNQININNILYDPSTRKLVQTLELVKLGMDPNKAFRYVFMTPLSKVEIKKIGTVC